MKRLAFLLLGIIMLVLGTSLAVTIGVLGVDDGSGSGGEIGLTLFFILLAVALVALIIGAFSCTITSCHVYSYRIIEMLNTVQYRYYP